MMRPILVLLIILSLNFVGPARLETREKSENADGSDGDEGTQTTGKPANVSDDGYDESRFWARRCPPCYCAPPLPCPPARPCSPARPCPPPPPCPTPEEPKDEGINKKDICPFGGFVTCNCDMDCPDDEEFVCGSDGVTYQNDCFLKQARCETKMHITLRKKGPCRKNTRLSQCPESCAHVPTSAICNSDGYSLNNICQLKKENCGQKTLKVYHRKNSVCT